ncbi:hypothetical protein [Leptospira noguchii]|uniref:hypothetical protein n=1 Tax=Leptospira noguchii TaxID=28182 RepID=UPI0015EE48C7|nr:hypothetical protein [Leptospira noguchii]UOG52467.1 hypothetical protein MAL09_18165 [Leptospira noguchii]
MNSAQRFPELSVSLLRSLEVTQRLASRVARQVALETQHNAFLRVALETQHKLLVFYEN